MAKVPGEFALTIVVPLGKAIGGAVITHRARFELAFLIEAGRDAGSGIGAPALLLEIGHHLAHRGCAFARGQRA